MIEAFFFFFFTFPEREIKGNRGEWSELYAMFKLLADGKVHAGDADMNKLDIFYPVLNIVRNQEHKYAYKTNLESKTIVIYEEDKEIMTLPMSEFEDEAKALLKEILNKPEDSPSFPIPNTSKFMSKIGCDRIKVPSTDKADIQVCIHDISQNLEHDLGFSIKSQLGSPSTLLNASKATNFTYKVTGCNLSDEDIKNINSIAKPNDRIKFLQKIECRLEFVKVDNQTFMNNLLLVDFCMPQFLAECLLKYNFSDGKKSVMNIVSEVAKENPLNYPGKNAADFYAMKMKNVMMAAAMGLMPSKEWNGVYTADGGYLVVRKDGDVVCYHFYNVDEVKNYLYHNTRFENGSRSRHGFGSLYREEDGQVYIKFNLQIRFKK